MVRGVVGTIFRGGGFELLLVPASTPRLVLETPWYVISCLHIKEFLLLIGNVVRVAAADFLSRYLSLPHV